MNSKVSLNEHISLTVQPYGRSRSEMTNMKLYLEGLNQWVNIHPVRTAGKLLNRKIRSINGNRNDILKIVHWNVGARLWPNKRLEIELLLAEKKPDMLFITEANLWNGLLPGEREFEGHSIILPNTMASMGHARIALIVKNDLHCQKLDNFMDSETATIWVRVGDRKNKSIVVGGVYREHQQLGQVDINATRMEKQKKQENRWRKIVRNWVNAGRNCSCIVIGDMNLDYLRWANPEQHLIQMVEYTQDIVEIAGFTQLIQNYTRSWRNQADSLLDHVWSNCDNKIVRHFNEKRGDSDHNVVGVDVSCSEIKSGGFNVKKRRWKNFKKETFQKLVKDTNWNDILEEVNTDIANSMFEDRYCAILNSIAPMCTVQTRTHYNKWISSETKSEMILREELRLKARHTNLDTDWIIYRQKKNLCTRLQKSDKAKSLRQLFDRIEIENDSAALHSSTRALLGLKRSEPPRCFKIHGRVIRKQKDLAETQSTYYHDKVSEIRSSLPRVNQDPLLYLKRSFDRWFPPGGRPKFQLKQTNTKEVLEMICNLKNSHSFGRDLIDAESLKCVAHILAPTIAHIINLSLGNSQFPQKWKLARVVPLLKSRDSDVTNPASFRPVAQLPLISKLGERTVQLQILKYLEESAQLHRNHHAYRQKCSTATALLQLIDTIAVGADMNLISASMSIDLSAAFDCVDHSILQQKLQYYGFDDLTLNWINSYLSFRSYYVVVGSAESNVKTTFCGVPQGSVMGPLLYLLYVNELPSVVEENYCGEEVHQDPSTLFSRECSKCGSMPVFADDGKFIFTSKNRHENQIRIEEMFIKLRDYLNSNLLQINESKTSLTEYMTKQKRSRLQGVPPELTISEKFKIGDRTWFEDKQLTDSTRCRFLGLNFMNNLTWDAHLLSGKRPLLTSCRRQIGMYAKLKSCLSLKAKLRIVNSLVLSRMEYMICIWGNTTPNMIRKAQIALNMAGRFVTGKSRTTPKTELMELCKWNDITERTEIQTLVQIWKIGRWKVPEYMGDKIVLDDNNMITTAPPRLQLTASTFRWVAVKKWNALPDSLRAETSLKHFKSGIKRLITDRRRPDPDPDDNLPQLMTP